MFELRIAIKARKEIKKLLKKHQKAIIEALRDIQSDPYLGKALTRDLTEKLSYRVGMYRIIYKINAKDKIVEILSAGHRESIYN